MVKGLSKALQLIEKSLQIINDEDSNHERFSQVERNVLNSLTCYQELYHDKKNAAKQSTLTHFLFFYFNLTVNTYVNLIISFH